MRSQSYGNIPPISSKHPIEAKVTLGYAEKRASLIPARLVPRRHQTDRLNEQLASDTSAHG